MNTQLQSILLKGPATVSTIADEMGVPKSQVQKLLREDQTLIRVRKEEGQNLYWLEAGDVPAAEEFEASEAELAAQATRQEVQAVKATKNPPAEKPAATGSNKGANTCPLCQAEADQVQAGPEGSYLGACRTCAACGKTYNVFSKEEVKMAKEKSETKRSAPLNPQYKINAKIAAAEAAGGKLIYQREGRTWLLTKRGVDSKQMTAVEFSVETAESISKYLGVELAPKPAKAAKAPKAPAKATKKSGSAGAKKASTSKKTSKGTGSGAAAPASEPEKTDAELVG